MMHGEWGNQLSARSIRTSMGTEDKNIIGWREVEESIVRYAL